MEMMEGYKQKRLNSGASDAGRFAVAKIYMTESFAKNVPLLFDSIRRLTDSIFLVMT